MDGDDGAVTYRQRLNAFQKTRTYRLSEDAIDWEDEDGATGRLPFWLIKEVRISFPGGRMQPNLYRTRITIKSGATLDITNSSFVSLANFEDRSAAYAAFIRELHRRLAANGGKIDYRKGSSRLGFLGNILASAFSVVALLAILWFATQGAFALTDPRFVSVIFALPLLWLFMKRTRPATYEPGSIPPDGLPEA